MCDGKRNSSKVRYENLLKSGPAVVQARLLEERMEVTVAVTELVGDYNPRRK